MVTQLIIPAPVEDFIGKLESMAGNEGAARADLARLKRCAGRTLEECPSIYPLFYRLLPPQVRGNEWEEAEYFLVASLFPFAPKHGQGNFGQTLAALKTAAGDGQDGINRRMAVLLDCTRSDLHFRLRQLVQLAASKDAAIDWRSLLVDLRRWDHPRRLTQKAWARSYFGGHAAPDASPQEDK